MNGFTQVVIAGNLTKDPEVRQTPQGNPVCNISLAVNTTDKNKKENVEFFDVTLWANVYEPVAEYKKKGDPLLVSGELNQRTWETPDGQKRSKVSITGRKVIFMPRGEGSGGQQGSPGFQANQKRASAAARHSKDDLETDLEELPF